MLVFEFKTYGKSSQLVKRADGMYVQFCIDVNRKENTEPSGNTIGLDVGLKEYYTDSNRVIVENPKFLRQGEKVLKRSQRRTSPIESSLQGWDNYTARTAKISKLASCL